MTENSLSGPILRQGLLRALVYINDIIDTVESDIRIFADDTFIFRIADQNSTEILNRDIAKITRWAHDSKMLFNPISKPAISNFSK